mmetsp:Transcript_63181/g.188118  ORF Transcript_63181/g.188118 Transcript_63181/m.188118 type:complete len:255 (+) Transcript_63181:38-802(+)
MPGVDFAMPPRQVAVLHHHIEIVRSSGFGTAPHYVQFYALSAAGWHIRPKCVVNAVTQTSSVRGRGDEAVFGFPIDVTMQSEGVPSSARPPLTLFFSIMSVDVWERHCHLGYAHFSPRPESGTSTHAASAWTIAESRENALHSFFVGGVEEVRDLRAITIPDGFDGSCLNKHGLTTNASGTLHLRVNTVLQQEQELATAATRPRARSAERKPPPPQVRKQHAPFRAIGAAHKLATSDTCADKIQRRIDERSRGK